MGRLGACSPPGLLADFRGTSRTHCRAWRFLPPYLKTKNQQQKLVPSMVSPHRGKGSWEREWGGHGWACGLQEPACTPYSPPAPRDRGLSGLSRDPETGGPAGRGGVLSAACAPRLWVGTSLGRDDSWFPGNTCCAKCPRGALSAPGKEPPPLNSRFAKTWLLVTALGVLPPGIGTAQGVSFLVPPFC